jgi:hypothetical protein
MTFFLAGGRREGLIAYQYNKMGTSHVQVNEPAARDVKKSFTWVF